MKVLDKETILSQNLELDESIEHTDIQVSDNEIDDDYFADDETDYIWKAQICQLPEKIKDTVNHQLRSKIQHIVHTRICDGVTKPAFSNPARSNAEIIYAYAFWVLCMQNTSAALFERNRLAKRLRKMPSQYKKDQDTIQLYFQDTDFPLVATKIACTLLLKRESFNRQNSAFHALNDCPELKGKSAMDLLKERKVLNIPPDIEPRLNEWGLLSKPENTQEVSHANTVHKPVINYFQTHMATATKGAVSISTIPEGNQAKEQTNRTFTHDREVYDSNVLKRFKGPI
jgi:hypothetical protein